MTPRNLALVLAAIGSLFSFSLGCGRLSLLVNCTATVLVCDSASLLVCAQSSSSFSAVCTCCVINLGPALVVLLAHMATSSASRVIRTRRWSLTADQMEGHTGRC